MKHIFYLSLVIPVLYYMTTIADTVKFIRLAYSNKSELTKTELAERETLLILAVAATVINFIGLFTEQWIFFTPVFASLFLPMETPKLTKIRSGLTLLFIFLAVINEYHLHLTL